MWQSISNIQELESAIQSTPTLFIFKHSTRCSISSVAKNRIEKPAESSPFPVLYIDLLQFRDVSNHVAQALSTQHESPQLLKIENGSVTAVWNHFEITANCF